MKKIILLGFVLLASLQYITAQTSIVGKWKLVASGSAEDGKMIVADSVVFYESFWKSVIEENKKTGEEIKAADSIAINNTIHNIYFQMNNTTLHFLANKTYKATFGKEVKTGTYAYNAKTMQLVKRKKDAKKSETSKVTFEGGQMVIEDKVENILLYFEKMK